MQRNGIPDFQDFIANSPIYTKFANDTLAQEVFEFLSTPQSVYAMIVASENKDAALFALVSQLDSQFGGRRSADFSLADDFSKQAIGNMARVILEPFGYVPMGRRKISSSKSANITSATAYAKTVTPRLRAVQVVNIEAVTATE